MLRGTHARPTTAIHAIKGTLIIAATLFSLIAAPSAALASDTWADAVIEAMKAERNGEQKPSPRKSVRVASLAKDMDTSTAEAPAKKKPTIAQSDEDRPQASKRRTRVASLGGNSRSDASDTPKRRSLSGGSVDWTASSGCLNGTLRGVLASLASDYGQLRVNSTCRSRSHNANVGGASKSYHLTGDAADFRVFSNIGAVYASLRGNGSVGGLKHYGGGLFHIDTGPRRSW
jgi:hypothetical protein